MRLYNTLTRQQDDFAPSLNDTVRMYTCGLTVYARGHIGQEELHVIEMNKLLRDYSIA